MRQRDLSQTYFEDYSSCIGGKACKRLLEVAALSTTVEMV